MTRPLFLFSLLLLFAACEHQASYQVVEREILIMDDETCQIKHRYPEIQGLPDSLMQAGLNRHLRELSGLFKAGAECLEDSSSIALQSDYKLHLMNDTLLSLEIYTLRKNRQTGQSQTVYFPLSIKLPEGYFQPLQFSLSQSQWNTMQEALRQWQEEKPQQRRYNEHSYIWGDSDLIPFCLSKDSLILFPGGEGEGQSYQRLSIAKSRLK